jgi:hypothetical protein
MANYDDIRYNNTLKNPTILGTEGIVVPVGDGSTTPGVGRNASPALGTLRYNTAIGLAEFYTVTGWTAVDAPPTVTTVTGIINQDINQTITVNGTNFKNGSTVFITGNGVGGIDRQLVTTFVNSGQLTAATNAAAVNFVGGASFNVKVSNPSGLTATLSPAGNIDREAIWNTSAGSVATVNDSLTTGSTIVTLSASDPDSQTISYDITSGALPPNTSLNTSTGAITTTSSIVQSSNTTYNFTVTATSNTIAIARAFSITINLALNGTTAARANVSATAIKTVSGTTTNGLYYVKPSAYTGSAQQMYCIMDGTGGSAGWTLAMNYIGSNPSAWGGLMWYGNSQWDTQDGSFNTGNGLDTNQKTSAYGYLPHNEVMFIVHNVSSTNWRAWGRYSYTAGYQGQTLYNLLSADSTRNKVVTSGGRAQQSGNVGLTSNDRRTDDCGLGGDLLVDGTVGSYNMGNYNLVYRAAITAYGWNATELNDSRITTTAAQPGAGNGQLRGHHIGGLGMEHVHSGWSGRAGSSGSLSYCDANHAYGGSSNYSTRGDGRSYAFDFPSGSCGNAWEHGTLNCGHAIFIR